MGGKCQGYSCFSVDPPALILVGEDLPFLVPLYTSQLGNVVSTWQGVYHAFCADDDDAKLIHIRRIALSS